MPTASLKQVAFHVHFLSLVVVFGIHFYDPPSMPPITGFGIICVTFALALLLPPYGMISPDKMGQRVATYETQTKEDLLKEKKKSKKEE